jgi:hypothetical protein
MQTEPFSEDATGGLPPGIVTGAIKDIELTPLALKVRSARLYASLLIKNIKAALHTPDMDPLIRLAGSFHAMILEAAGTRRIRIRDTPGESASLCMDIIECLLLESPAECEKSMRRHIFSWRERMPSVGGGA